MHNSNWRGSAAVFVAVFVLYVLGASLAWWTINTSGLGAVFFPPAGLTVVAFLALPHRRWPVVIAAIVAGEIVTGYTVGDSSDLLSLLGFAASNVIGPLLGALGVAAMLGRPPGLSTLPDLGRRRELAVFGLAAVLVGPFVSSVIGALTVSWRFDTDLTPVGPQWWLGDALGVVVVAPLFLVWTATEGPRSWRRPTALSVVVIAWVATIVIVSVTDFPLLFLALALLVLGGVLFDVRIVALASVAIAVVVGASLGIDPNGIVAGLTPSTALTVTKLEFLLFAITAYAVAAETNERMVATDEATRRQTANTELQRLLLPPPEITGAGFRVRSVYDAAVHEVGVGGDWHLATSALDGRLVFGVGDIVGHDLDAARTMATVRSGLMLEAAVDPRPDHLLRRLDRFAAAEPSIRYGTAWIGAFDHTTRILEYSCAGHISPLLVDGESITRLHEANTALVALPQGKRWSASVLIPEGASVVLFSDGLIERRESDIEAGLDRLEAAVLDVGMEPSVLLAEMLSDSPRHDDTILVVVDFERLPECDEQPASTPAAEVRAEPRVSAAAKMRTSFGARPA